MFIEAIVISLIIGFIRGGKLRGFRRLNKVTTLLFILGAVVQYLISSIGQFADASSVELILRYIKPIQILSYLLILVGLLTNYRVRSIWPVLVGYILNFISLVSNGWLMPDLVANEVENVKLAFLGKTIQFFEPYPLPKLISLGDLIIAFGIFSLIQEMMLSDDGYRTNYRF